MRSIQNFFKIGGKIYIKKKRECLAKISISTAYIPPFTVTRSKSEKQLEINAGIEPACYAP